MNGPCSIGSLELQRFRDGTLPAAEAQRLMPHIEGCTRCQGRLSDFEAVRALLGDRRALAVSALPVGFATTVMSALPSASLSSESWRERLGRWISAHRDIFAISVLTAGAAAALLVVFAPSLRSEGDRTQEAVENEAQIHRLDVSGTDQSTVVLQSAEGNTVIWLVPAQEDESNPPPAP